MPPRRPLRLACLTLLALLIASTRDVAARPLEVPTFAVGAGQDVAGLRVASGVDNTMTFAWYAAGSVRTQLHSQAGTPLAPPVDVGAGSVAAIDADTRGGYVVAFTRVVSGIVHLFARRLDAAGQPLGAEFQIDDPSAQFDVVFPTVIGLPSGFVFVWQQQSYALARLHDPAGAPRGAGFMVGENGFHFPLAAARLAAGGFVVVWHDPSIHTSIGRTYDGDGATLAGPAFLAGFPASAVPVLAGHPAGGFAAVSLIENSAGMRLGRFTEQITLIEQVTVDTLDSRDRPAPAIAADHTGNWHVLWGGARYDTSLTQIIAHLAPSARPLAADLTPLEPSFVLSEETTPAIATALLPSGSFVNAWSTYDDMGAGHGYANVVSLCTADVHVCGDGVLDARCEECDAGAANSDTTADACRTDCTLPHCGDGTTDSGEACDAGGASQCSGCDAQCQLVSGLACGDGILVAGCGDQCDDGNDVVGDGCGPTCTLERVPGGGSRRTDCITEWVVNNPTNDPLLDRRGHISRTHRCVDDDPQCDFDGGGAGRCTFRVRVCANNTNVADCTSAAPLTSWELVKPSITRAAGDPSLAAVRAAFGGVAAELVGTSAADGCSGFLDLVVPLRTALSAGKLTLKSAATVSGGVRDKDTLKLICLPRP